MHSFYSREELETLGFRSIGENVLLSRKASIYGAEKICIGNHVRIDDFCILSGKISLGNYIHIAAYTALYGGDAGIEIQDFANISSRNSIYAISDDYSGQSMTNPLIPEIYKKIQSLPVLIERHVIIGPSSVTLPGVTLREGSACGALSFINKDTEAWTINVGIPCKRIKQRSKEILNLEKKLIENQSD